MLMLPHVALLVFRCCYYCISISLIPFLIPFAYHIHKTHFHYAILHDHAYMLPCFHSASSFDATFVLAWVFLLGLRYYSQCLSDARPLHIVESMMFT